MPIYLKVTKLDVAFICLVVWCSNKSLRILSDESRDCLCDECESLISNSMPLHLAIASNPYLYLFLLYLWFHLSRCSLTLLYFILFLYSYFHIQLFLSLFSSFSKRSSIIMWIPREKRKNSIALWDSWRTGIKIRLALANALSNIVQDLMKIDCFDKDNDVGNNNVYRCGAGDASIRIDIACKRNERDHTMSQRLNARNEILQPNVRAIIFNSPQ